MKLLITETQCKFLIEEYSSIEDYFDYLHEVTEEIFSKIKNKEKIFFKKINPNQYQAALRDFVKFGEFTHFPTKYVYKWKSIMIEGVAMLEALTSIHGHSQHFPFEEFYDVFDYTEPEKTNQYNLFTGELEEHTPLGLYSSWARQRYEETGDDDYLREYDWNVVYEFLDDYCNIDEYVPFFKNGQPVLSDFGLEPLQNLAAKLLKADDANNIIIIINKMLDITHPRGDLAELFIVGGSSSLDAIAGYEKEKIYN